MRMARAVLPFLLLVLGGVSCGQPQATIGRVQSIDSHVMVLPSGDLQVNETIVMAPDGDGLMALERRLESPLSDGVELGDVVIDGVAGDAGLSASAIPEGGVHVSWRPDGSRGPTTIDLQYRVIRAVAVLEPRGRLEWQMLDEDREFDIDVARVRLMLPDEVRTYEGTGMAEPGWTVVLTDDGAEARREYVPAHESATLLAVLDIDRSRVQQGQWEWDRDRRENYFLALIAAGLFILVIGAGVLVVVQMQYPAPADDAAFDERRMALSGRESAAEGLRTSALVTLPFAALIAAASWYWLSGLGSAVLAIPASMLIVSLMFLGAAWWYGRP